MRVSKSEREEAIARLRDWIKPGDTVYTVLDSVSRSGMSRHIRVVLIGKDGVMFHPNYAVGKALGLRHAKRNGWEQDALVVSGCGMDMGFHIVSNLGMVLYPKGYGCIGEGCPSNDHTNGDRDYTPHESAQAFQGVQERSAGNVTASAKDMPGHWHGNPDSGCYAFKHRWI